MDISMLISEYLNGASMASLSKKFDISVFRIKGILKKNNIHIRPKEEQNKYSPQNQRKYKINDNYFDEMTRDGAYLLGFLAADGAVQKTGAIKIGLSSVDRKFLEKIREILESNYPIKDYMTNTGYNVSEFAFRSEKIKEKFAEYGIVRNKTYNFSFPKNLPRKFWIDFIRGYFDGDGTICLSGIYARTSICSYRKEVLEDIVNFLEEDYNIEKTKIYKVKDKELYYFQYSQHKSEQLYKAFYSEMPNLYLERKYQKFYQLFGEIKSHESIPSQRDEKLI